MDFLPDTDVSVRVMFEGLGQPKVPDTGTVSWTLRGDAGDIVLVDQPLSPGPASSSVIVTVPAVQNAIVARYEKRTLITKFSSGGIPYTVSMRYRLVPFLNLEIGPENVRKFVGVNPRELPDDEIDLTRAYFDIEASVTQPVLELMLAGTPAERKSANNAILATVVIECIPSLKLRVAQSETDGPLGFPTLPRNPGLRPAAQGCRRSVSAALDTLIGRDSAAQTLITVSTPIDVITGA